MLPSAILGLVNNAALLLALGVLYDMPGFGRPRGRRSLQQAATGLALGGMCIAIMLNPWQFRPGVIFDTRSVLLSLSGLFFGTFPTAVAALIAAAFRLAQGGGGAWTGVIVIFVSGAIGVLWRHARAKRVDQMRRREFYLFGWVVHIAMLLCMFTLPQPLPAQVLPVITVPVLAIYPVATALMGWLLANRDRLRRAEAERQAAVDALRASETRFRELYEHMGSGVAIYEALPDGTDFIIRDLNEAGLRITGVRREDVVGRLVTDVFPGVRDMGLFEVFQRVWRTGVPERHAATLYKNGRLTFWAENQVYKLPSGEIVAIFDDITERRQALAALRESEAKLRTVFNSSADLITIADMETGVYLDVNDGFLQATGYARDEVVGKTGDDL
ncbi:MAG: LytS/YhcK type 5TM receptor domain-containing protein, partial [Anaerolineae bacterium]